MNPNKNREKMFEVMFEQVGFGNLTKSHFKFSTASTRFILQSRYFDFLVF